MNAERVDALIAIIRTPDLFDCWRQHHVTQPGTPERFARYRDLPIRYANVTRPMREEDPTCHQ